LILAHQNVRNPKITDKLLVDDVIYEVTKEREIVWEYVSPFFFTSPDPRFKPTQQIYRAYRVPYDWVPQRPKPVEKAVIPPENSSFGSSPWRFAGARSRAAPGECPEIYTLNKKIRAA
jgi:hypothetical protein